MASSWLANAIVITHIISVRVIMFHITMARSSIRRPRLNSAVERCCKTTLERPLIRKSPFGDVCVFFQHVTTETESDQVAV